MLAAIVVIGILAVSPWLATDYFDGNWMMVVALVAAFAAYAPAHLARGICSGSHRFHKYAIVMGTDGVVRIMLCVALAVVGVTAVGAVRVRRCAGAARRRRVRLLPAAACAPIPAPRRRGAR